MSRWAGSVAAAVPKSAENDVPLGMAIKQRRDELGLSQERLALEAGLTTANLSRVENGLSNPTWATVRDIARALDLSASELAAVADQLR